MISTSGNGGRTAGNGRNAEATRGVFAVLASALVACGSVAGGDPAFWQPAEGISGPRGAGSGGFVAGGGYGGQVPPSSGGYRAAGGTPPFGQGGAFASGGFSGSGGDVGSGGFGGTGGAPRGTGGTQSNSGSCNFRFDVTTTTYGGRFSPRNVGAIYVENSSGTFVKSLNVWGTKELYNLTDWQQASGGNLVDAVTGATRADAGLVSGAWDCTDVNRQPVPDEQYQACCSFQEDDALPFFGPAPKKACVTFGKGTGAFTQSAPDQGNFTRMTLTMQ